MILATLLAMIYSILTTAVAAVLLRRLWAANRDGKARLRKAVARDDLPRRVVRLVRASVDAGLLPEAGPGGLADVEVRAREARDPYRTAGELIDYLARESAVSGYAEVNAVIKAVYQLGHALGAREGDVVRCLEPLLARLKACKVGGSAVARVECIRQGALLDARTMAPLSYGARVSQPLGVVVYDGGGKVLGKAKVLCG
jgi:hypothetical protein